MKMMATEPRCHVIIVAAGIGQRFGATNGRPKQYQAIGKQSVLAHSIAAFDSLPIAGIVVVLHPEDTHWSAAKHPSKHPITTTQGGDERHHSVLNGLKALGADDQDWVMVHDAARPCVSAHDINCLMEACQSHQQGGLLATPVSDTIKLTNSGKWVEKTLDRSTLYAALTPQMFPYQALFQALEASHSEQITDEASAMEQTGAQPLIVPGQSSNLKITTQEDLIMAMSILKQQGRL